MSRVRSDRVRLEDLPSVLDIEQIASVLGVGPKSVSGLVHAGRLGRLAYSPNAILVAKVEVRRFLRESVTYLVKEAS